MRCGGTARARTSAKSWRDARRIASQGEFRWRVNADASAAAANAACANDDVVLRRWFAKTVARFVAGAHPVSEGFVARSPTGSRFEPATAFSFAASVSASSDARVASASDANARSTSAFESVRPEPGRRIVTAPPAPMFARVIRRARARGRSPNNAATAMASSSSPSSTVSSSRHARVVAAASRAFASARGAEPDASAATRALTNRYGAPVGSSARRPRAAARGRPSRVRGPGGDHAGGPSISHRRDVARACRRYADAAAPSTTRSRTPVVTSHTTTLRRCRVSSPTARERPSFSFRAASCSSGFSGFVPRWILGIRTKTHDNAPAAGSHRTLSSAPRPGAAGKSASHRGEMVAKRVRFAFAGASSRNGHETDGAVAIYGTRRRRGAARAAAAPVAVHVERHDGANRRDVMSKRRDASGGSFARVASQTVVAPSAPPVRNVPPPASEMHVTSPTCARGTTCEGNPAPRGTRSTRRFPASSPDTRDAIDSKSEEDDAKSPPSRRRR